jgi:hypothetical protein
MPSAHRWAGPQAYRQTMNDGETRSPFRRSRDTLRPTQGVNAESAGKQSQRRTAHLKQFTVKLFSRIVSSTQLAADEENLPREEPCGT